MVGLFDIERDAFMRRFLGTVFSDEFLSSRLDDAVSLATMSHTWWSPGRHMAG
jgi:hypothetical protein